MSATATLAPVGKTRPAGRRFAALPPAGRAARELIRNVEVFYTGTHTDSEGNTQEYTRKMVQQMADNFSLLAAAPRPVLEPPIGIGHDSADSTELLWEVDTNLADGTVVAARTQEIEIDGKKELALVCDFSVVPEVKQWIDAGHLTRLSAEVDENPPPEGESLGAKGWVLKRVALLGFTLPALKRLRPLPKTPAAPVAFRTPKPKSGRTFYFSDRRRKRFRKFADEGTMDRQQKIQWLVDHGYDAGLFTDATPDALLDALIAALQELETLKAGQQGPDAGMMGDQGQGQGTGGTGGGVVPTVPPSKVTLQYSEYQELIGTVKRLDTDLRVIRSTLQADRQNRTAKDRAAERAKVHSFCEAMVKENRLAPAEIECDKSTGEPLPNTVLARLLRAADSTQLHTFSEAGKQVQKTELELQMDELRKSPVRKFGERIPAGSAGTLEDTTGEKWKKIREAAIAERAKTSTGPTLEQRLGMLPLAGQR